MSKTFDYIVFIDYFSPISVAQQTAIEYATTISHNVVVLINGSNRPKSTAYPFSFDERETMIRLSLPNTNPNNLIIKPIFDYMYDSIRWMNDIYQITQDIFPTNIVFERIKYVNYVKSFSNQFGMNIPNMTNILTQQLDYDYDSDCSSTVMFRDASANTTLLPQPTAEYLSDLYKSDKWQLLTSEYEAIVAGKKAWSNAPFPPTFVTTDCVITKDDHVLTVVRGGALGKGLRALPGGFFNPGERLIAGALRELKEETQIMVPDNILLSGLVSSMVFDHPRRSARGPTITHAYHFTIKDDWEYLPDVIGSDDAQEAIWLHYSDIKSSDWFEDHYEVLCHFIPEITQYK